MPYLISAEFSQLNILTMLGIVNLINVESEGLHNEVLVRRIFYLLRLKPLC